MTEFYRHFKGNIYLLLDIAKDSETLERVVIYQAMYGDGDILVQPYELFFGKVNYDGKVLPRFAPISEKVASAYIPIELNPKYHFPHIKYGTEMPTMLHPERGISKGVKGMVTLLISSHLVPDDFFTGMQNDDDIEKEVRCRILAYKTKGELESIFHLIQTWGGTSGRGIYVFGDGFVWSKMCDEYERLVNDCLSITDTSEESIAKIVGTVKVFNRAVNHMGISFITKHTRFWLFRTLGYDALPIYDSIMANEVMRKRTVSDKDLDEYWRVMVAKARKLGIGLMPLERQIFQYSLGTR